MNTPAVDDESARFFADACNCLVISIDYRKAPQNVFPAGYEDVVQTIQQLLSDSSVEELSIDLRRVVLCGASAGGNFVLGVAQDERLRGKIHGLLAVYPLVSMVPTADEMLASRPDPDIPDFLGEGNGFLEIYLGTKDRSILYDPRISPTYFPKRSHLPDRIFVIGCEHDMLCYESRMMTEKLAAGLERMKLADGWKAGGVRWKLMKGQLHAFDHFPVKDDKEREAKRLLAKQDLREDMANWFVEAWKKQ